MYYVSYSCEIFTSVAIMYHTDLLHSHPEMTDCLGWAATAEDHLKLPLSFSHFNFWRCVNQSKIKINTTQRSVFGQIKRKTFLCWKDVGLKILKLAKMPIVHLGWLKKYFSGNTGHSDWQEKSQKKILTFKVVFKAI